MENNKAIVVIPVYQEVFSASEITSIRHTLDVFGPSACCFVAPRSWKKESLNQLESIDRVAVIRFEDGYFKGVEGYNRLLLTKTFYQSFAQYSHILICQPDAWVFNNQLDHWMQQPYDYFGAPLITGKNEKGFDFMPFGGNGGFSLRKVTSHLRVLKKYKVINAPREVVGYYKKFHRGFALWLRSPLILAGFFGFRNNSKYIIKRYGANEDIFWSKKAALIDHTFKPAPVEAEIPFSFEKEPATLYALNHHQLPFGCHAWEKYEPEFWKTYIR